MCHESSGLALTETIGVGKGSVLLEDLDQADLIIVAGQNPGTNHPRMLSALEKAKRGGTRIIAVNPLPEAGLMRFKNPQTARGIVGRRHRAHRPVPADPPRRRPGALPRLNRLLVEADRDDPAQCWTRSSSPSTPTASTSSPTNGADSADWADVAAPPRACTRERDRAKRCEMVLASQAHHRVLGDGPDPAQALGAHHPRGRQLPAAARQHRPPGRGRVPGPRAQQRAGRPHDGHLRAPTADVPRRARRRSSASSRRASTATTRCDAIRAMRDGKVEVFFAMGGNFVVRLPRHRRSPRPRCARVPADRARVDEAQPLPRRHRRRGR